LAAKGRMTIVLCLAVFMVFAWAGLAGALPSDIQGHWAEQEISDWTSQGLSSGYADGTYRPDNSITRAEFITLVNRSFGFTDMEDPNFTDVSSTDWFYNEIAKAKSAGYISGNGDNTMLPDNSITRQEVAAILVRLLGLQGVDETTLQVFSDAGAIQSWARPGVAAVVKSGLMKGYQDQTFLPLNPITRAEALVTLQRALDSRQPVITDVIAGIVTQNGSPVKDAAVRVYQAGSFEMLQEAVTDGSGSYSVKLPPGQYDLTASTADGVAYASAITVNDVAVAAGNLSLQPGTIARGTILDAKSSKVAGATVLLTTNPTFRAVTDSQGSYLIVLLPDHNYTVRLYQPGHEEESPIIISTDLVIGKAGIQSIVDLKAPFTVSETAGGGGNPGGADTTPPTITAGSVMVSGAPYPVTISKDGLRGSINLQGLPATDKIATGTIDVSEDSEVALQANIPNVGPIEVSQELVSGTNTLDLFNYFSLLGPEGVSLGTLKEFFGSSASFAGTLTDDAGNVSNMSLTLKL